MSSILANIAVPIFFPQPFLMLLVLVPVVVVETLILRPKLGVGGRLVLEANALSTLCGVPLAFLSIVLFNGVLSGGHLLSCCIISNGGSLILTLATFGAAIIPCFILSVWLEGYYLRKRTKMEAGRRFWLAMIRANCYSYLLLFTLDVLWFKPRIS